MSINPESAHRAGEFDEWLRVMLDWHKGTINFTKDAREREKLERRLELLTCLYYDLDIDSFRKHKHTLKEFKDLVNGARAPSRS